MEKFRPAAVALARLLPRALPAVAAHGDPPGSAGVERPADGETLGNGRGPHPAGQDHLVPDDAQDRSFGSAEECACFRVKRGSSGFPQNFHWDGFHPQQERDPEENQKKMGMWC